MENSTETENFTFNCLAYDNLSDFNISDRTPWRIADGLEVPSIILAAVYILFFLIAFFWNLFIVVTYLIKYKLLKHPGNLFLFNLALADLLLSVTVMMFSFVAQAAKEFVFGSTDVVRCRVCDLAGWSLTFLIFMTFHLLAALSIDRFILLSRPLRYKKVMTFWRAMIIVIVIWVISLAMSIPPFIGFGQMEFNRQFGSCIPRFTDDNLRTGIPNLYYVVFGVVEALIPISIIAFTNVFTYRLVSKFLQRNIKRKRTFRNPRQREANSEEERKHKQQQQQLVRVFGALCIANCVAWTPVILVVLAAGIFMSVFVASQIPSGVFVFGWICYLSNPVIHPIIESFFVKDLRYQVKRAQRTIRRASTAILRTTSKKFRESDLDKANAAMDSEVTPPPKRTIKFFNSRMAKKQYTANSTMDTEEMGMDEMTSHHSTPSPTPEAPKREVRKMVKVGRSVTFTESPSPPASSPSEGDVVLKSVLKRSSDTSVPTAIQLQSLSEVIREDEEDEDVFQEENGIGILSHDPPQPGNSIMLREEEGLAQGESTIITSTSSIPSNGAIPIVDQPRSLDRENMNLQLISSESTSNSRLDTLV